MCSVHKLFWVSIALVICLSLVSCSIFPPTSEEERDTPFSTLPETTPEETTPEETTPEVTAPEETTPAVTEPDFSNDPDPDGTKRY